MSHAVSEGGVRAVLLAVCMHYKSMYSSTADHVSRSIMTTTGKNQNNFIRTPNLRVSLPRPKNSSNGWQVHQKSVDYLVVLFGKRHATVGGGLIGVMGKVLYA